MLGLQGFDDNEVERVCAIFLIAQLRWNWRTETITELLNEVCVLKHDRFRA